ncbi:MAG: ATP-binding protein [Verrucomicrobiia bacterium]
MIARHLTRQVDRWLTQFPAVAILGPRQCGKSTLARALLALRPDAIYLDLEKPSHHARLRDAEAFLDLHRGQLICLDEIQRQPDLFPVLRSFLDDGQANGQILLLGSASRDLIRQSSETLAGRIGYLELTPFRLGEVAGAHGRQREVLRTLWLRGGFPRSFLAADDRASLEWRQEFIRAFLERDIPQLGFNISAVVLRRFWQMCAHVHGQLWNGSKLGESMGVSHTTIRSYVDLLSQTYTLRVLPPCEPNLKKRLIRSPKVYVRDTGLLHALLDIESLDHLMGHPTYGASWEGLVVEHVASHLASGWRASFYRSSTGSEADLVLEKGGQRLVVECKASSAPQVNRGFWTALSDLNVQKAWVAAPVSESYPLAKNVTVVSLSDLFKQLSTLGIVHSGTHP